MISASSKPKLLYVVASPATYHAFLTVHILKLRHLYDITVVGDRISSYSTQKIPDVNYVDFPIKREITILIDLICLLRLTLFIYIRGFDIVHSVTPKAGFIAMLASRISGVRHRFHTFTGQVWATRSGWYRSFLKSIDFLTMLFASSPLADSHSQVSFLHSEGFTKHFTVLGDGSISGVDLSRFKSNHNLRAAFRRDYKISSDECVFVFLGRLCREKGVFDLIDAFRHSQSYQSSRLVLTGPHEGETLQLLEKFLVNVDPRIIITGHSPYPECILAACDVFCLPSYREGFGSSVLEAAAVGLPAIVSRIYGLLDAVIEGKTGLSFEASNVVELSSLIDLFASSPRLRRELGTASLVRVQSAFSASRLTDLLCDFYVSRLTSDCAS